MPSGLYEIEVRGPIGDTVLAALEGLDVVAATPDASTLRGWVVDASALHGMLNRISGFGLELTSVLPVDGLAVPPVDS